MTTRLFIENREIELDETVQFAITKQFEDLSNPTIIINDWSKTVSIPFTARNNAIFGHIYNPDKLIVEGGSNQALTGIYFNQYKKLDMRLQCGDDVLMVGYAKINDVKQTYGKGVYNITLFGLLGKVFQEMKKITFDTTTDNTNYLIDGSEYVNNIINKELIYDSWTHSGQTDNILRKCNDENYNVHDIIGFAPNNSFSENFNYDTFLSSTTQSSQFTDVLGDTFKQATGIDPQTVIPNGLLPREIGEYRSYLQLPYIYWNKLFLIFKEKSEEVTGYSFDLDVSWFNNDNPYWYNLVYMLNSFVYGQEQKETNRYELVFKNNNTRWGSNEYTSTKSADVYVGYHDESSGGAIIGHRVYHMEEVIPMYDTNADTWSPGSWGVQINTNFTLKLRYDLFYKNSYEETKLGPSNGLKLSIVVRDTITSTDMNTYKLFVCASNYNGTIPSDVNEVIYVDSISTSQVENDYHWSYITFNIPAHLYIPSNTACTIAIRGAWVNTSVPFVRTDGSTTTGTNIYLPEIYLNQSGSYKDFILTDKKRSGSPFILNDLWNKEFNLFDEVLKYCKMFRIGIQVDEFNKKIIFKPIYKYFDNYSILNWTEKVDKSKDFVITPITFENKYVLFNHDDNETKLGQMYKEKYGVNYGDYRLITEYNFNFETKKLFDKVKSPIVNTDNVMSWDNLYNHSIVYSMPAEISVYNKDKDNKQVNIFGSFYFHNGVVDFDTEEALHMRNVFISDDSQLLQSSNTFFYSQTIGPKVNCTTYPKLDIVRGDNMCVLNIPKENYTYLKNYSGKKAIYYNLWEKYINERYNIQNKIITCYIKFTPEMWNNFSYSNFIKIDNQICFVNKIYDYDITSNQPTKVDLVTIQDINGYTKNNYVIS